MLSRHLLPVQLILTIAVWLSASFSQAQFQRGPNVVSPELKEGKVTFRILAPNATKVLLSGSDIPGAMPGVEMKKNDEGIWEAAIDVAPGYYRYNFNVDGVSVIDPRNPATSESVGNSWSLVGVPGAEWMDTKDVPHGAVAEVTYHSKSLNRFRRMHVYTPPGYEKGDGTFQLFIFCMVPETAMTHGRRLVEPASFWTISSQRAKPSRWWL